MKKERAIIIKDPRLRKARNELRTLLKLWKSNITSALHTKIFTYIESGNDTKAREFHGKISNLDLMEQNSIILCPSCGRRDQDMGYVPTIPSTNEWGVPNPYAAYTHEWICIECNAKRVHFAELKGELIAVMDIQEFFDKLSNGVELSRSGWNCNGYEESERILFEMEISKETQDKFLELCGYYSGYCDCEILLNAARFLSK